MTLYAQWRLQHRFNYDSGIFYCYNTSHSNEVWWAYAVETVKVEVIDGSSEYTIYVTGEDGTDIAFDTETNTFTMPDQEVYVTSTNVKKMAYTTILLENPSPRLFHPPSAYGHLFPIKAHLPVAFAPWRGWGVGGGVAVRSSSFTCGHSR